MKTFITFITFLSITSCSYLNKKFGVPDDHPLEERMEDVLEEAFDVNIDLTREKNNEQH